VPKPAPAATSPHERLRADAEARLAERAHDSALVERAARGDVTAFAALYDRHAGRVLALITRVLGARSDAEDVLHDTFVEAWLSAGQYDSARGSALGWLLIRARSRALDHKARTRRLSFVDADQALAQRGVPAAVSEQQLAVRTGLSRLTPELRSALELVYFEGLTAPEVAAQYGLAEGTVRSRLARGLSALQQFLSPSDDTEETP
jgi:RNA polymerase sigma-70 factor (ECF subfamily)